MQLTVENVRDLLAIREAIAIHPPSFRIDAWIAKEDCGTTLCIGGHWAVLRGYMPPKPVSFDTGNLDWADQNGDFHNILDVIPISTVPSDGWIFHLDYWPAKLKAAYKIAATPQGRVAAGQQAIDRFIAERASPADIEAAKADLVPAEAWAELEKVRCSA